MVGAARTIDGDDRRVPEALRAVHRSLPVGAEVRLEVTATVAAERLADLLVGAGFAAGAAATARRAGAWRVRAERLRTLPDSVGPDMRLLVVGLNPSLVAADAGYGFAGPTNRFWKAAALAGAVSGGRDPGRALAVDGLGMTDLVKRATPRSAEVTADEYRTGADRVERLVAWLAPAAVCVVGLEGWRVVRDRRARPGWQPAAWGGRPAYVMPSTSGLNASARFDDLVTHLRAASAGPGPRS